MARTAVVAGTATAVSGGVQRSQQAKAANAQSAADAEAAQQQAVADSQAQVAAMQAQMAEMQAAQSAPPPVPAAAPAGSDFMAQLEKLANLKAAGLLDDAEFAAAKARLLSS